MCSRVPALDLKIRYIYFYTHMAAAWICNLRRRGLWLKSLPPGAIFQRAFVGISLFRRIEERH
jgi:hypothetical protein